VSAVDAVARWAVVKLGDARDGMLGWFDDGLGDVGFVGEVDEEGEKRVRR